MRFSSYSICPSHATQLSVSVVETTEMFRAELQNFHDIREFSDSNQHIGLGFKDLDAIQSPVKVIG